MTDSDPFPALDRLGARPLGPAGWLRHLPAMSLFIAVVVFTISELADRYYPYYAQGFTLSLLPLVCLPACRLDQRLHGRATWWLGCAVAGALWLALVQLFGGGPLIPWAFWTERVTAITIATVALVSVRRDVDLLTVLGAAAACALITTGPVLWYRGDTGGWFAMANINYFVNSVGPVVLGWLVYLGHRLLARRKVPWSQLLLAAVGFGILVAIAVVLRRRGVQLAIAAATALLIAIWLGRRFPRTIWTLSLAGSATVLVAIAAYVAHQHGAIEAGRVRIALWRAAWGAAVDGLPWGLGEMGIARSHEFDHQWHRFYSASGNWNFHAHNEFLDALIDGGVVLFGLLVAQCAILVWHIRKIADRSLQVGLAVLAGAAFVHMLTSVAYGTAVGNVQWHLFAAAILAAGTTSDPARPILPRARWLLLPLVAVAGVGGAWLSRNAFIHKDASIGVQYKTLTDLSPPIGLVHLLKRVTEEQYEKDGLEIGDQRISTEEVINEFHRVYGDAGPFLRIRFIEVTRNYADALRFGDEDEILRRRSDFIAIVRRMAKQRPFDLEFYRKVRQASISDPVFVEAMDPRLLERASYANLDGSLPPPDLSVRPTDIDGLADLFVRTYWSIVHGVDWQPISGALEHLVRYVGHVPEVGSTAIRAAVHAGVEPHFGWTLELVSIFRRNSYRGHMANALDDIGSPWRARGVMPLLEAIYPKVFARIRAGRNAYSGRRGKSKVESLILRAKILSQIPVERPDDPPGPGDPSPPPPGAPAIPHPGSIPVPAP